MNYMEASGRNTTCSRKIDSDSVEKMVDILVETKSKQGIFSRSRGVQQMLSLNDFEKFVVWKHMPN